MQTVNKTFSCQTLNPKLRDNSPQVKNFVLVFVACLHLTIALQLSINSNTVPKKPVVMEVAMVTLPKPEPPKLVAKEPPPPAPPEVKKEVVKPKPIVKPPEPLKKIAPPKPVLQPKVQTSVSEKAVESIPKFEPAPIAQAPSENATQPAPKVAKQVEAVGQGQDDTKTIVSGVIPISRVEPRYPPRAVARHIEGWVKIEFTILPDGSVSEASVVNAQPEGTFDESALDAIQEWKFKPKIINGIAVKQRATQTLQFKLANE
jgi:protein TonB